MVDDNAASHGRSRARAFHAADADRIALRTPDDAVRITWGAYGARVRTIAAGLAALGVRRGDTVGLMMVNRPEFALCDTAALHLGAIPFSVYNTFAPEQIADVFAPDTAPGVAAPRGVPRQRGDVR